MWHLAQEQFSGRGHPRVQRQGGLKQGARRSLLEAAGAKEAGGSQNTETRRTAEGGRVAVMSHGYSTGSGIREPGRHIPGFTHGLPRQVVSSSVYLIRLS